MLNLKIMFLPSLQFLRIIEFNLYLELTTYQEFCYFYLSTNLISIFLQIGIFAVIYQRVHSY